RPLALTLCALVSAGRARAGQSTDSVADALLRHMAEGVRDARPGDWISYRTDAGNGRVSFWRFSVVGAEKDARGRDSLWIEIELGQHGDLRAPLAQIRMLVARQTGLSSEGVTRVYVALGVDRPQEISPEQLRTLLPSLPESDRSLLPSDADWATVRPGSESRLMTHAGTLPAIPIETYRQGSLVQRIWISHRLPLLHLAKLEMPGIGHAMEVTGFGDGALPRMVLPPDGEAKVRRLETESRPESPNPESLLDADVPGK
ncbi:MAG TPA: hypothetical protein VN918_03470, partial [Myxococcaceae bacterium]|nr:hypothetical protein [Myxococcaceae bacterium]